MLLDVSVVDSFSFLSSIPLLCIHDNLFIFSLFELYPVFSYYKQNHESKGSSLCMDLCLHLSCLFCRSDVH